MKKETNKTKSHNVKHHKPHKKVFDVVPPGKAPASATSRPVITGHKPPVADGQFVPGAPLLRAADPSEKHELLDSKEKKRLEPTGTHVSSVDKVVDTAVPPEVPAPSEANRKDADTPQPASDRQGRTEEERLEEERTAGHLAVEQFVEADDFDVPTAFAASSSSKPAPAADEPHQQSPGSSATDAQPKTIDDLLAETGAPSLEPTTAPTGIIISHHASRASIWAPVLIFLFVIVLGAVVLNFLLDAGIIETTLSLPHTDVL